MAIVHVTFVTVLLIAVVNCQPQPHLGLSADSKSNSTHVNITVNWKSPQRSAPQTPLRGYVIYYQPKGGAVNSVNVSNKETENYLLEGLQRGVTYNISIVAWSHVRLPSVLVGPITVIPEPILTVEVSPSSVTISVNDQFTVTCTVRAEVDGQGLPVEVLRWVRITNSSSGSVKYSRLNSTEYDITRTGSPESGYQSILTTTENDTVNMIIYLCRARISTNSTTKNFSDVIVTIEGTTSTSSNETTATSTPSSETTATSTPSSETTPTSTSSSETTATSTPSSETTPTSTSSSETTATSTPSSETTPTSTSSSETTATSTPSSETTTTSTTEAGHCSDVKEMSRADNTAVVTGGVGGVMGLIILIQSVVIVVLILRQNAKNKANKRTSTEGEHKMVVTSSNEAYGVVTVREEHEYDVIGPQQTHTQHSSPASLFYK